MYSTCPFATEVLSITFATWLLAISISALRYIIGCYRLKKKHSDGVSGGNYCCHELTDAERMKNLKILLQETINKVQYKN